MTGNPSSAATELAPDLDAPEVEPRPARVVDVIVLGAGSGGENLAQQLAEDGLDVLVVEKHLVGGECPYLACMPSKSMLHDAFAGRTFEQAVERRRDVTDNQHDDDHVEDLRDAGVALIRGTGRLAGTGVVEVTTDDEVVHRIGATHVVIATGASEITLDVPGADEVTLWDSADAWTAKEQPSDLLVVGGGPVGVEIATAYARFGSRVVLVDRGERLVDEDEVASRALQAVLEDAGIEVVLGASVERLERTNDDRAQAHLDNGRRVEVDVVATGLGKRPRLHDLGLDTIGIDPDELEVDATGRVVGAENLWALGDVAGTPPYTHVANAAADVIASNIPGNGRRTLELSHVPRCVFSVPPLAAAGTTDPDEDHVRVTASHEELARAITDETGQGESVLVVGTESRRVLGFAGVGAALDEVVGQLALAIRAGVTIDRLADTVQPFPTHSEIVRLLSKRALAALDGRSAD